MIYDKKYWAVGILFFLMAINVINVATSQNISGGAYGSIPLFIFSFAGFYMVYAKRKDRKKLQQLT